MQGTASAAIQAFVGMGLIALEWSTSNLELEVQYLLINHMDAYRYENLAYPVSYDRPLFLCLLVGKGAKGSRLRGWISSRLRRLAARRGACVPTLFLEAR